MITTVIITYNEEEVLEEALKSLNDFADKILIIDSNSTDRTVEIAKKHNTNVINHKMENFAAQRNFALKNVNSEWIFYLDADERLTPEFKKEAKEKIANYNASSNTAGFFIKRKTFYFGKDWRLTDQVQRLFYREKIVEWFGKVHETPKVRGNLEEINAPIIHNTHRNLSQMIEKTNKWSEIEAKLRYDSNHPEMSWWRFPRVMIPAFFSSYTKGKGYKNGTAGIVESIYQAYSIFVTYAKLWEIQKKK